MAYSETEILRFALADHAFREALAMTQHLLETKIDANSHLCSCAMAGIAVCYCRPFMRADGLGPLPDAYRDFPTPELKRIHETVFEARNKLTAHLDVMHVAGLHAQGVIQNHPGEVKVHLTMEGAFFETTATYLHPDRLPEVKALCEFQMGRMNEVMGGISVELLKQHQGLGTLTFRVH